MKKIPLTGKYGSGSYAMVDDEYYDLLMQKSWMKAANGYVERQTEINGKKKRVFMHRFINNTPEGMETDHIDGDTLNNQRSNLRNCTPSQNACNRKKQKRNTSGYKGVTWNKRQKRYVAVICKNYKSVHIGSFKSEIDAAKAYNKKALEFFGEFARLNEVNP